MGYTIAWPYSGFFGRVSGKETTITADTLEDFGPALDEISEKWKEWYYIGETRSRHLQGNFGTHQVGFNPHRRNGKWELIVYKGRAPKP